MANTYQNTFRKIGDTIENILGSNRPSQPSSNGNINGKQTCLEKFGIEARNEHLYRNEWQKDLQYTKALVDAEYLVQTEFKVGDLDNVQEEMETARKKQMDKDTKKLNELIEKRKKLDTKIETLQTKTKSETF